MISESIFRRIETEVTVRQLSPKTATAYNNHWEHVRKYFPDVDHPKNLSDKKLKEFLEFISETISPSSARLSLHALRFYYRNVEGAKYKLEDVHIKKDESKLPDVIPHEKIMAAIRDCKNPREKAILATFYGTGIRREELIMLKRSDIDRQQMVINIRNGKGNKHRIVPLTKELLTILYEHWNALPQRKKFSQYLFPGEKLGNYISASTASRAVEDNLQTHPHALRHSYATYLYDHGEDLLVIARILGHKNLSTTEIYTHVSAVRILKTVNTLAA